MKKQILVAAILMILVLSTSGCLVKGKGMAKDTIHSMEEDGFFWKTWSVWLTNDHPSGKPGEAGYYSAIYSVPKDNKDLIKRIQEVAGTNKTMIIYYENHMFVFPWEYSSDVVITDIKPVS